VRSAVEESLRRKLVTIALLRDALKRLDRRRANKLRELLGRYAQGEPISESELERAFLELLEKAGLPLPAKQRALFADGRWRVDFVYEDARLVIELDGYAWHSTPDAFERDHARDTALAAKGFRVMRLTWNMVQKTPDQVVAWVREALGPQGD
jgi:very-short-patch-repair endonuclease